MTKATFIKRNGIYTGFDVKGHSGFADSGEDIVCAAISALTINTVNSIDEFTDDAIEAFSEDGLLTARLKTVNDSAAQVLMKALVLGLENIQEEYGKKYLKVDYKEEMQDD